MAFVVACVDVKNPQQSDFILADDDETVQVFFKKQDAERAAREVKEDEAGIACHILEVK